MEIFDFFFKNPIKLLEWFTKKRKMQSFGITNHISLLFNWTVCLNSLSGIRITLDPAWPLNSYYLSIEDCFFSESCSFKSHFLHKTTFFMFTALSLQPRIQITNESNKLALFLNFIKMCAAF